MALVTGTLRNFGIESLAPYSPQIVFTPSGNAVLGDYLLATDPIVVTPQVSGVFEVNLAPTVDIRPDCWYTIAIQWLDAGGNYIRKDFPDWKLRVPSIGGTVTALLAVPANPAQVWVGETPPPNPVPGTWWLNPTTGELKEWN